MNGTNIWSSGKALPIPSTSITGRPEAAPASRGSTELAPPASQHIRDVIRRCYRDDGQTNNMHFFLNPAQNDASTWPNIYLRGKSECIICSN